MTTYNTQNPVGSADPRDLYDNAQVIDDYANSDAATTDDRLGVERATIAGIDAAARAAIANAGYEFIGDYAAGIELTAYNQVVRDTGGEFWRVSGSTALPYTTTGAGLPEGGAFVSVGDAALRQELAADGGGLVTVVTSTGTQTLANALDDRVAESYFSSVRPEAFGATGDGVADDTAALQAALDSGSPVNIANDYLITAPLIVPRPCAIFGRGSITTIVTDNNCLEIVQGTDAVGIRGITINGQHEVTASSYTAGSNGIRGIGSSTAISENITIVGVTVHGFGENGIRFDFCDHLVLRGNDVNTCGRAGIQFRSCHHALIEDNDIVDIKPGAGGVDPFLNAYGIHMTQSNTESRVSENFDVLRNRIKRIPSWTGIDTHGGHNLNIAENLVDDCLLGIVMMGPGGGSTATTSASFCNIINNKVRRNPSNAPNSRPGILIAPSSSGVSASSGVDITVRGNWVERHGSNIAGATLEGAIRIQDVLGLACEQNTIVDSYGIGLHIDSGTFGQVIGNIQNNHITTVIQVDAAAYYARFSNEGGRYVFDNNLLYRSGGDAIALDANVTPTSSANGCILGADNELVNFVDDNPARKKYSTGTLNNLSIKSLIFSRAAWKVGVNADGTILSGSAGVSSVSKGVTGEYTINFNLSEFSPGAGSNYYLEITTNVGSPAVAGQSRTNTSAAVTIWDLNISKVDRGFTATVYWVFKR